MVELKCNVMQEIREGFLGVELFTILDLILGVSTRADYISNIALLVLIELTYLSKY